MQVWPGTPYPLGATYDGAGTNVAVYSAVAERVELCLFDAAGAEQRVDLVERDADVWHGYLPGLQPGQRYGFRVHGPYDPGAGPAVQPGQAAARPVRQGDRRPDGLGPGLLRLPVGRSRGAQRHRLRAARPQGGRDQPVLRLGGRPRAAYAVPRVGDLRGARQGAHGAPSGDPRGAARHVRRGRAPGDARALPADRRDCDRADAGAPVRAGPPPGRAWADQLLGLQHPGVLRTARRRTAPAAPTGEQVAGVQGDGPRPAPGRARGDPRRRLQPHRRGQRARSHAVVPWHRQHRVLPPGRGVDRSTTTTRRAPATAC